MKSNGKSRYKTVRQRNSEALTIMKVYKYRSLRNFDFVADIICNRRFYAAPFFELNDPMEGLFEYPADTKKEYIAAIVKGKRKLRICSFSKDPNNPLLWAHYADGFRGVCIEVDLQSLQREDCKIVPVKYPPTRSRFSNDAKELVDRMPEKFLSRKSTAWEYEKEVRTLSKGEYVQDGITVKSVLLGIRTPDVLKEAIAKIAPRDIHVYETQISDSNNIARGRIFESAPPQTEIVHTTTSKHR